MHTYIHCYICTSIWPLQFITEENRQKFTEIITNTALATVTVS